MKQEYKKRNFTNFILVLCMCINICCISIGYAAMSSTMLTISGTATAQMYEGMYILDVAYSDSSGADLSSSKIVEYVGTMLHTDVVLSPTDTSSYITYEATIYNNSDFAKKFTGVTFAEEFYSNNDIKYELIGLNIGDHLHIGESQTFSIRFYYDNISTIVDNELDSYLNFNYDYYYEEVSDLDILITSREPYSFPGVSPENPVMLQNIANINFVVGNGMEEDITGINVELTYTTTTGSKQAAGVKLYNANNQEIGSVVANFQGKQNNATVMVQFTNLSLSNGDKVSVKMDINNMNNGQVSVTGVVISPI